MDDEIILDTIEWSAPEYSHKEHSNDWFWAIGLIAIIACGIAIWLHNYVFAIFILLSGGCLIMFTMRPPQNIIFIVETKGLTMGRDLYMWKNIKSFNINNKTSGPYSKLLIETRKHFLPIYTLPFPKELENNLKENLLKVIPRSNIHESQSMAFAEKLGV